jgi:hypothetical protein
MYGHSPLTTLMPFAVHPDMLDAGLSTVVDDIVGGLLGGHDENAVNARLDFGDSGEARLPIDLFGERIHRDRLVAALTELLPQHGTEPLGVAVDADDGDALEREEIVDLLLGRH